MSWARVHRWLGIGLVVLLAVWSITGLLFHLKPGWDRAYDQLSAERRASSLQLAGVAPVGTLRASAADAAIVRVELFDTALGALYRITTTQGTELVDATTGLPWPPLDAAAARTLASDAITRSPHRDAYGAITDVVLDEQVARLRFASGAVVEVGRRDARISQRGPDTDRIDWLYRIHYLQWTGHRGVDRVLSLLGLALIWAVLVPGIVLFVRRVRGA
ncbi:MAG: PepSY domain-containing protein [Myxococcota bacterium]|nr:PepSY domain-containing protein [Myxococcota bacterium]